MFQRWEKIFPSTAAGRRRVWYSLLATFGYILSPLSWWNDLVVNVPIAYVMAWPLARIDDRLFLPSLILAYWFTNVLGFVLLHRGVAGLMTGRVPSLGLGGNLLVTFVYTVVISLLVVFHWLPMPHELLSLLKGSADG